MGVACLEFRGENFRGWRENRGIRENFLPRKFPAIRYTATKHQYNSIAVIISIIVNAKNY